MVVYSTFVPTEQSWRRLSGLLKSGDVAEAVVIAKGLEDVITTRFQRRPFAEVFPELRVEKQPGTWSAGKLTGTGTAVDGKQYSELGGDIYSVKDADVVLSLGDQPLVVRKKIGRGVLNILLFDPTLKGNIPLARDVYRQLLNKSGIHPHWTADEGTVARIYRSGQTMIVGVQSPQARDWSPLAGKKGSEKHLSYNIQGQTRVKVKVPADTAFEWFCMPAGKTGRAVSDADGWLTLEFTDTAHEIFFLRPASEANSDWIKQMQKRKELFQESQTLGGLTR